jgi:hypothetical protein
MPVSRAHKAIFVHIPKTAGTSVEAVLGMHGEQQQIGLVPYFNQQLDYEHLYGRQMQHMTAHAIKAALNDDAAFHSYFKFTIVRNPWDRLVSALAWTDQKWARGEQLRADDFARQVRQLHALFMSALSAPQAQTLPDYLYPQSLFIFDADQRPLVDFVARFENLQSDWLLICDRLGLNSELPCRMRSHHGDYREYYDCETRSLVAEMYALDARVFQYEF